MSSTRHKASVIGPKKYNLFFLGYWCLESLKNSFKNLPSFKILDHEQEKNDNEIDNYVKLQDDICKNIVKDITKQLNKLHNKKYSEKILDNYSRTMAKNFRWNNFRKIF